MISISHKFAEIEQQKKFLETVNQIYENMLKEKSQSKELIELEQEKKFLETVNQIYETEKNEQTKVELVNIISHELRTPMVPIKGYIEILKDEKFGKLTADQKNKLEIISKNSDALLRIISKIIDVKKIESNSFTIIKTENQVNEIISDAIDQINSAYHPAVKIHFSGDVKTSVFCDHKKIIQVLFNIMENSLNQINSKNGQINIKVNDLEKEVKITIQDNGPGIAEEFLSKIFSKNFQIDMSTSRKVGGLGVGLYLCKYIIEQHEGKIWAESNHNSGTRLICTIPHKPKKGDAT